MGTLTANDSRLPGHCEHKLPTSCRLSSIPQCCACADERPYAASYSTYIDGVGWVPRGNRWQRYCWYCKEFWQNRVQAAGLQPSETRIPGVPDQTEFLDRWYDFHRGYRLVIDQSGNEERVAVVGEELRLVAPGVLPRTVQELRTGRQQSELAEQEARQREVNSRQTETSSAAGPSIESALDLLFQAADLEESDNRQATSVNTAADTHPDFRVEGRINALAQPAYASRARNHEYQIRRVAGFRRELQRIRSGIERVVSGLRDLGEDVPEATNSLREIERTLDSIPLAPLHDSAQQMTANVDTAENSTGSRALPNDRTAPSLQYRVDEARTTVTRARASRDRAASALELANQEYRSAESRLRQLHNEQRTAENYTRIFGTREEMIEQGDSYESPISRLFTRAEARFREAEEVRREEQTLIRVLHDEEMTTGRDAVDLRHRLSAIESSVPDIWGIPRPPIRSGEDGNHDNNLDDIPRPTPRRVDPEATRPAIQEATGALNGTAGMDRISAGDNTVSTMTPQMSYRPTRLPGLQLGSDPTRNNDRVSDAMLVLTSLSGNAELRAHVRHDISTADIARISWNIINNSLNATDRALIERLLADDEIIWASGLQSTWNTRRRSRGDEVKFTPLAWELAQNGEVILQDIEIMAECFQMSARVRERSGLSGGDQLNMLNRLQSGGRTVEDKGVLFLMVRDQSIVELAEDAQSQFAGEPIPAQRNRSNVLDNVRHQYARRGNSSQSLLGDQGMGVDRARHWSDALVRQVQRDYENGPAGISLFGPSYIPSWIHDAVGQDFTAPPLGTESDPDDSNSNPDEEARGLDAKGSGRPDEPMTEEEMTVKLDCRICYSQLADVACLPCGHLVMCKWCSEQHSPVMAHDRTRPRMPTQCPVCRKNVRQKVTVFGTWAK